MAAPPTDPRDAAERLARYDGIERHPGWQALAQDLDALIEEHARGLGRSILLGQAQLNQTEIERWRGFVKGARWILSQPLLAENTLKLALMAQEEEEGDRVAA